MSPTPSLDHLILFLPAAPNNFPTIPSSITKSFTLTPGGTHADGLTSNTLILLADGCYIELISFITSSPEKIEKHWWGPDPKRVGWADWCLTTTDSADANYPRVQETHDKPREGGRQRPDGQSVKWAVTFPSGANGGQKARGSIPFFCHDVTPRDLRVPLNAEKTTHPSGVLGVRALSIIVKDEERLEELREIYNGITGTQGEKTASGWTFQLGRVVLGNGLNRGAIVNLRLANDDGEKAKVKERGLGFWYGDVVLGAKAGGGKEAGQRERVDGAEDNVGGLWIAYE
ncbi:glyoxalase-like domain-containing protein [Lophiotrema nucula]|uniref:Glyoxalase-like domain-containing protein n=1 Tax=Lophiotrema nucula TaxID=690887 RepID=A0A6A5YUZ9_9PLEO|nr:glyoxalase-like domain-containing protein [Lophiotrema nucula]